jgi:trehalose 6-phosphate phosphatase
MIAMSHPTLRGLTLSTAVIRTNRAQVFLSTPSFGHSRALLLDYDGTIAPFVSDRSHAYPYASIPELLDTIMADCETRVAVVSGRSARDIPALLHTKAQPDIWGSHGLERLKPTGEYTCVSLDENTAAQLRQAETRLANSGLESSVESKPGCIAVHWRGLGTKRAEQVKAAAYQGLAGFVGRTGLWLSEFDGGLELRSRSCNKRSAVEAILSEMGPEAAIAYLGDDQTDEDAFRALNGRGLTILVRSSYRFTAAQFWLQPPDDLKTFLTDWIRACRGEL